MRLNRRDVLLATAALILASLCVWAGSCQLDRLGQRRARNAAVAARLALPPLNVGRETSPDSARQRRVVARGTYDFARERVWRLRSFDGTPGVALITPLRLADGSAVFVDRGWVPSPDAYHVDQALYREPDTATVEGLVATMWFPERCATRCRTLWCLSSSSRRARPHPGGSPGAGRHRPRTTDRISLTPYSGSVLP